MINFTVQTFTVVDGDLVTIIDNTSDESLYSILSLQMDYTIISSKAVGNMVLIPRGLGTNASGRRFYIDKTNKLQEGQIVKIYKQWISDGSLKPVSSNLAYFGFIERIQYKKSSQGMIVIVIFSQMLTQFTLLPATQTKQQSDETGIALPGIIGNTGSLDTLLLSFTQNSLMEVAQKQSLYNNNPNIFNVDPRIPSKVFVYSDLNSTRDDVLRTALAAWNVIMWQQENGQVNINPLALNNKANTIWNITDGNFISYQANNNAGVILNQLIQFYMIPAYENTLNKLVPPASVRALVTPDETYFPRLSSLYETGKYTVGALTGKSVDRNIMSDPVSANYLTNVKGINNTFTTVAGEEYSIAELYGQQELAESLCDAYNFLVVIPATQTYITNDLPLGQISTIVLDDDVLPNSNMLCVAASVSWSVDGGTYINFQYDPILSVTGIWVDEMEQ